MAGLLDELDIPRAISAPPHLDDRWAAQLVRRRRRRMRCAAAAAAAAAGASGRAVGLSCALYAAAQGRGTHAAARQQAEAPALVRALPALVLLRGQLPLLVQPAKPPAAASTLAAQQSTYRFSLPYSLLLLPLSRPATPPPAPCLRTSCLREMPPSWGRWGTSGWTRTMTASTAPRWVLHG